MIYDCFLFNGEDECLDIRINELKELDVKHIVVEANFTFSGISKEPKFDIQKFPQENVNYNLLIKYNHSTNPWENEADLRNAIKSILSALDVKDDDVIIISDADEIPNREVVKEYSETKNGVHSLVMDMYGMYLNLSQSKGEWKSSKIMRYSDLRDNTPNNIRNAGATEILNGGWHFSWLGGADKIMEKFKSFSHQEPVVQQHANKENILHKLQTGKSLWGEDKWERVDIKKETHPQYLVDNVHKFKHLIMQKPNDTIVETKSYGLLDEIGKKFGTDKASTGHNYLRYYDKFFAEFRTSPVSIMEIGVWGGSSVRMWKEYFPEGKVSGFDIDDKSYLQEEGIGFMRGDQSNPEDLKKVFELFKPNIVVDDGSHQSQHQIISFETLFPLMPKGSLYCIEDCLCGYFHQWNNGTHPTINEYTNALVGAVNMSGKISQDYLCSDKAKNTPTNWSYFDEHIEWVFVSTGLVIVKKID